MIRNQRGFEFIDLTKPKEPPKPIERKGLSEGLAFSPDGRMVAVSYIEGSVQLWDMATLQPVETLKGFLLGAHGVTFSPDGRYLMGINFNRFIHLWSAPTFEEIKAAEEEDARTRN